MGRSSVGRIHEPWFGIHHTRPDEAIRSHTWIESLLAPITCARLVPTPHTHAKIHLEPRQRLIVSQPWMRPMPGAPRSLDGWQGWRDRCCFAAPHAGIASLTKSWPYDGVACWDCADQVSPARTSWPVGPHSLTLRRVRPPRLARTTNPKHRENAGAGRVSLGEAMFGQRPSADAHRSARRGSRCPG